MRCFKAPVGLIVLVGVLGCGNVGRAQPRIAKDRIPADIPVEVRQNIEGLYSADPIERSRAAGHLCNDIDQAPPAIPFLIAMFHDDTVLYDARQLVMRSMISSYASPFPQPNSPGETAARALGRISKRMRKPPIDLLLAAMEAKNRHVRANAIMTLGEMGDLDGPAVLDPLVAALDDECPKVRANAVRTLTGMELEKIKANDSLIKGLLTRRLDEDRTVRVEVMRALGLAKDSRAVVPLIVVLANRLEDPEIRRRAADALGELGDPAAVPRLTTALEDNEWQVRFGALAVLDLVDDPQVLGNIIISVLQDKHWRVRARAVGAAVVLSERKDPRSLEILVGAMDDQDANVRGAAAKACGDSKDPRTVMPLTVALAKDQDSYVRGQAAKALGELGDPRAVESLNEAMLKDQDNGVRTSSERALKKINETSRKPR